MVLFRHKLDLEGFVSSIKRSEFVAQKQWAALKQMDKSKVRTNNRAVFCTLYKPVVRTYCLGHASQRPNYYKMTISWAKLKNGITIYSELKDHV